MRNLYVIAVLSESGSVDRFVHVRGTSKIRVFRSRDAARHAKANLSVADPTTGLTWRLQVLRFSGPGEAV